MNFKRFGIPFLFMFIPLVFLGWNHLYELRFEEPRRAIVTWEMMHFGDPIKPTIHGWAYYNKPPFFNWIMAFFCWLFNSFEEWAIRLPSTLSLLATGFLFYRVGRKHLGNSAALLVGFFSLTSYEILIHSSVYAGEIDLFFLLLTTSQALTIFIFHQRKQYFWMFCLSYFLAACGVLTKGLPSIAFQGITILAWLLVSGDWKLLFNWRHFVGIFLFIGLLGGYFYLYSLVDDAGAFAANLFKEASSRTALENTFLKSVTSIALFPLKFLQLLLPWSLLIIYLFRKGVWQELQQQPFLWFSFVFIVANIPLYWLSPGVKTRYVFMFIPFMYNIIAYFFIKFKDTDLPIYQWLDKLWAFVISLIGLAFLALPFAPYTKEAPLIWLSTLILVSLAGGCIYLYFKQQDRFVKILLVLTVILTVRLGYNMVFMPIQVETLSKSMIYRELNEEIMAITKDQPVHYGEDAMLLQKDIKIGPWETSYQLKRPPFFHYQIPYYLSKTNGFVMQFDEELQPDTFYLLPKMKAARLQMEVFKEFYPSGGKKKRANPEELWVLAKLSS